MQALVGGGRGVLGRLVHDEAVLHALEVPVAAAGALDDQVVDDQAHVPREASLVGVPRLRFGVAREQHRVGEDVLGGGLGPASPRGELHQVVAHALLLNLGERSFGGCGLVVDQAARA